MLELVGQASLTAVLPHMAPWSRVVVIGVGSGGRMEIELMQLMMQRIRIGGSTLRSRSRQEKADVVAAVRRMCCRCWWRAASGSRWPTPSRWPEADAAYERFAAGGKFGKVVLVA